MWGGGREAFYSPMIRFQSFSGPVPLDCEFHEYFTGFFFSSPFHGSNGQGRLELSISLPPGQLDSKDTPAGEALVN